MFIKTLSVYALLVAFVACVPEQNGREDKLLASVNDYELYESELQHHMPKSMDDSDSLIFVREYINNWIKEYLLIDEAENTLSENETDLSQELETYRREILAYRYQNSRMSELVNQNIPYSTIEEYYNKNLDKYKLTLSLVQVSYVIFPLELDLPNRIISLLSSNDPDDIGEVEEYIFQYAIKYDDFDNKWIYFSSLLNNIDYHIENEVGFLKSKKLLQIEINGEQHLIGIRDYLLSGETAPLEFVAPTIHSYIINQKKLDFLREIKDSLYQDALKYNKFRVFNY